ncbi:hypothetical protein OK074_5130 [Actinobacteria bacterium OK074]|nr:hypothetical protein OK074_5130 [Actinobacteria bacterium OK074]
MDIKATKGPDTLSGECAAGSPSSLPQTGRPPEQGRPLVSAAGLLLLAVGPSMALGAMEFAGMAGAHIPPAAERAVSIGSKTGAILVLYWLVRAVTVRAARDRLSRRHRAGQTAGAAALGITAVSALMAGGRLYEPGGALYELGLAWLAWEVTRANGLTPGAPPAPPVAGHRPSGPDRHPPARAFLRGLCTRPGLWPFLVVTGQGVICCLLGILLNGLVTGAVQSTGLVMHQDQMTTLGIHTPAQLAVEVVRAVAMEDVVVLGATVTLLAAARRPAWQIYAVIAVIEVLLHGYAGIPALTFALWAVLRVRLYLSHRLLLPLMISHAAWDLVNSGSWYLPLAGQVLATGVLVVLCTIGVLGARGPIGFFGWTDGDAKNAVAAPESTDIAPEDTDVRR